MPEKNIPFIIAIFLMTFFFSNPSSGYGYEGISIYYVRYDMKSSNNRLVDDNLLIIPAANDFRAENFSLMTVTGEISAAGKASHIDTQIRDNALKTLLVQSGLKSVKTKDHDTVISYEGVMKTPFNISRKTYNNNHINYEAQIQFSPISFPDRWKTLGVKDKIKGIIKDFFELFK